VGSEVRGESRAESVHPDAGSALRRAQQLAGETGGEVRYRDQEWPKRAAERAVGTRIRGEKARSPKEVSTQDETERGVDALEQESERAELADADESPSLQDRK
jgi:hypothetical protein